LGQKSVKIDLTSPKGTQKCIILHWFWRKGEKFHFQYDRKFCRKMSKITNI